MSVLVLIKNMKIPTSCSWCDFCGYYGHTEHMCDITKQSVEHEEGLRKRRDDCPLVELKPHGRLIDADAPTKTIADHVYPITDYFNSRDYGMFWTCGIEKAINEQPTIIPAEEGE